MKPQMVRVELIMGKDFQVLIKPLKKCRTCGKEAHSMDALKEFSKSSNQCLYCKAGDEWLKRNPSRTIEEYHIYKKSKEVTYLRKCKHCGKEAHSENELNMFVNNPKAKYGKKNVCNDCHYIQTRRNSNIFDKDTYLQEKEKRNSYKAMGILKVCRCCGKKAMTEYDLQQFSSNGNICKVCYNIEDTKHKRKRLKYATPPWITQDMLQEILKIRKECSDLSKFIKNKRDKYMVDHIYPIQHPALCGLNVASNLQILNTSENTSKNNRLGFNGQDNLSSLSLEVSVRIDKENMYNLLGCTLTYSEFLEYEKKHFKEYL